jgi:hypothetical protein
MSTCATILTEPPVGAGLRRVDSWIRIAEARGQCGQEDTDADHRRRVLEGEVRYGELVATQFAPLWRG